VVRKQYPRDEVVYNMVQENEIPLFLHLLPLYVEAVLDRKDLWTGIGRPPCNLYDILICLTVKEYFTLSLRRCIGLLKMFRMLGVLNIKVPCFKTLDNYLHDDSLCKYVKNLMTLTSNVFSSIEKHMATDATGIGTTCYSSWYSIRVCKKSKKRDHLMVHITIGTRSNTVIALDVRTKPGNDNEIFRTHVKRVNRNFHVEDWSADSAYLSRENCNAVSKIGANPWFRLKSNTTAKPKGSVSWKRMVLTTKEQPEIAKPKYHIRSNVESTNSSKKRKFNSSVNCRKPQAQRLEESFAWVGYNFSMLPRAQYEFRLKRFSAG
jgi:transposase